MRIITLSCMYGRHETVDKAVATWIDQRMEFIIVVSNEADRQFCIDRDIRYTEFSNDSLTLKWQAGLTYISEQYNNCDAVLIMGSDDMIEGYTKYYELLNAGYDYVEIEDAYILDSVTGRMKHWKGYTDHRKGEGGGAGRLLGYDLLRQCDWMIWDTPNHTNLDWYMTKTIKPLAKKPILITSEDVRIVDIKDAGSITPFDRFKCPIMDV